MTPSSGKGNAEFKKAAVSREKQVVFYKVRAKYPSRRIDIG
jgi:hypothetical protein